MPSYCHVPFSTVSSVCTSEHSNFAAFDGNCDFHPRSATSGFECKKQFCGAQGCPSEGMSFTTYHGCSQALSSLLSSLMLAAVNADSVISDILATEFC